MQGILSIAGQVYTAALKLNIFIPQHSRVCRIRYSQRVSAVSYQRPSQSRLPVIDLIAHRNRILEEPHRIKKRLITNYPDITINTTQAFKNCLG